MSETVHNECHSCGYVTTVSEYPTNELSAMGGEPIRLCALCANTSAGAATQWPAQYPNGDVLKTLCFLANHILDAIEARPQPGG